MDLMQSMGSVGSTLGNGVKGLVKAMQVDPGVVNGPLAGPDAGHGAKRGKEGVSPADIGGLQPAVIVIPEGDARSVAGVIRSLGEGSPAYRAGSGRPDPAIRAAESDRVQTARNARKDGPELL